MGEGQKQEKERSTGELQYVKRRKADTRQHRMTPPPAAQCFGLDSSDTTLLQGLSLRVPLGITYTDSTCPYHGASFASRPPFWLLQCNKPGRQEFSATDARVEGAVAARLRV
jgi:hypothetical protein